MPLHKHIIQEKFELGIWKVEEQADFFEQALPTFVSQQFHKKNRAQHLAVRYLLQFLCPTIDFQNIIVYNKRPQFADSSLHFSFSHSKNIAATIVSKQAIGLDIQAITEQVHNVVPKFLTTQEQAFFNCTCTVTLCILWALKEAMYKTVSSKVKNYAQDISVFHAPIITQSSDFVFYSTEGAYQSEEDKIPLQLFYFVHDNYVLAYCTMGNLQP